MENKCFLVLLVFKSLKRSIKGLTSIISKLSGCLSSKDSMQEQYARGSIMTTKFTSLLFIMLRVCLDNSFSSPIID